VTSGKGVQIGRRQSTYTTIVGDPVAAAVRAAVLDLIQRGIELRRKSFAAVSIDVSGAIGLVMGAMMLVRCEREDA